MKAFILLSSDWAQNCDSPDVLFANKTNEQFLHNLDFKEPANYLETIWLYTLCLFLSKIIIYNS